VNPFTNEFITDMLPYVEKHYRTINDRSHRAIAGLSMGGGQTLDIAFTHLNMFGQIGVFSSGASLGGGRRGGPPAPGNAAPPAATADASATPPGQSACLLQRRHPFGEARVPANRVGGYRARTHWTLFPGLRNLFCAFYRMNYSRLAGTRLRSSSKKFNRKITRS
jgi:hypothetical protein